MTTACQMRAFSRSTAARGAGLMQLLCQHGSGRRGSDWLAQNEAKGPSLFDDPEVCYIRPRPKRSRGFLLALARTCNSARCKRLGLISVDCRRRHSSSTFKTGRKKAGRLTNRRRRHLRAPAAEGERAPPVWFGVSLCGRFRTQCFAAPCGRRAVRRAVPMRQTGAGLVSLSRCHRRERRSKGDTRQRFSLR